MAFKFNPFTGTLDITVSSTTLSGFVPYTGATADVDLGTHSLSADTLYATGTGASIFDGTLSLASGSITDSSGAISFGNENLLTTGTLGAGASTLTSVKTATIFPPADSTTAIQINKADGTTNVLNVDTTNGRVGIGTTAPGDLLDIGNHGSLAGSITLQSSRSNAGGNIKFTNVTSNAHGTGSELSVQSTTASGYTSMSVLPNTDRAGTNLLVYRTASTSVNYGYLNMRNADTYYAFTVRAIGTETLKPLYFQRDTTGTPVTDVTFDTSGNVGIGTTAPTAVLHIKAGTATASTAPLKFTSGTLNTTAEVGAVEYLTDDFYGTITTGAARKAFVLDDGTRLTATRVPFATTNGRLTDDASATYSVAGGLILTNNVTTPEIHYPASTPTTLSGDVNDYDLGAKTFIRLGGGAADRIVTGILAHANGHFLIITNIGTTNKISFANESASSTAANRIMTTVGGTVEIPPAHTIQLIYDATSARWREMSHL